MPKYLSPEWMSEFRRLANEVMEEIPGQNVKVQYVATEAPEGDVEYYWVVEDGKICDAQLGTVDSPDFTITQQYENSVRIQKGELSANSAFMQGKMKVSGNMARLMALMPITNSPEWQELQGQIRAISEY